MNQSAKSAHSLVGQSENPAIVRAMESVEAARSKAEADGTRPLYHFCPPANWMNDPNGTIFANGYYQLFYQHNPYGDAWGHMHWGHARSKDLVHWEHLPIALWPSKELGEEHVFSGCAAINGSGQPMLFYTMVGPGERGARPDNQQWAALGDEEWIHWRKHPHNPILSLETHGGPRYTGEWRDPYIFHAEGRTFLVLGGATQETASVALYEAEDSTLARWRYHKALYEKPTSEIRFFECPNFFEVPAADGSKKWLLLTSPYAPVEYVLGDFDVATLTFTPQRSGILDAGRGALEPEQNPPNFYASNTLYAPDGRCILLGWVRGFARDRGWNGCLALPRVLTIGANGAPRQQPVVEIEQLREQQKQHDDVSVDSARVALTGIEGTTLEVEMMVELQGARRAGIVLGMGQDLAGGVEIVWEEMTLTVAGCAVPLTVAVDAPLKIRLFFDRSILEVFVNDGEYAITRVISTRAGDRSVGVFAEGGAAHFGQIRAWTLKAIW